MSQINRNAMENKHRLWGTPFRILVGCLIVRSCCRLWLILVALLVFEKNDASGTSSCMSQASIDEYDDGARNTCFIRSIYLSLRRIRKPAVGRTAESAGHERGVRAVHRRGTLHTGRPANPGLPIGLLRPQYGPQSPLHRAGIEGRVGQKRAGDVAKPRAGDRR